MLLIRSLLARAPECLLCSGTRVRRSSQAYGPLMGAVFVAIRCQECGRRFPLPRRVARTEVTLYSRIPTRAANKSAVETALRDALLSVPGAWTVEVRPNPQDDRWLVTLSRSGGNAIRLSLVPSDAQADGVYEETRAALRKEGLLG
jgi:hypothetical protein